MPELWVLCPTDANLIARELYRETADKTYWFRRTTKIFPFLLPPFFIKNSSFLILHFKELEVKRETQSSHSGKVFSKFRHKSVFLAPHSFKRARFVGGLLCYYARARILPKVSDRVRLECEVRWPPFRHCLAVLAFSHAPWLSVCSCTLPFCVKSRSRSAWQMRLSTCRLFGRLCKIAH